MRRNFIEAYYNTLDDNLRYLYGSWMVRIKRDEDREIVKQGHQDHVKAQAMRFDAAMRAGNPLMRDGLLRALHTHVLREGQGDVKLLAESPAPETVEGPFLNGYKWFCDPRPADRRHRHARGTGNDSDPPKFYEESAPLMNDALLTALDPEVSGAGARDAAGARVPAPLPGERTAGREDAGAGRRNAGRAADGDRRSGAQAPA